MSHQFPWNVQKGRFTLQAKVRLNGVEKEIETKKIWFIVK